MLPFRRLASKALRRFVGTITHVDTQERVAALTFDDGPNPESTPAVLDLLARHSARATFFVVGVAAQKHGDLIAAIARAGHALGVHSWDHHPFPTLPNCERRRQLRACRNVLYPYGQGFFRPPYGLQTLASHMDAVLCGYKVVTWNVNAEDWCESDPERIVRDTLRCIIPGSILLFHDAIFRPTHPGVRVDRRAMLTAIDKILGHLRGKYCFVTLPELLRSGPPVRRNWYVPNDDAWASLTSRW